MPATLDAVHREAFGRNESGRLRRQGRIPAVIYGGPAGPVETLAVDPKALMQILHSDSGVNTLIALKIEGGGEQQVLVKEYQLDPVGHSLLHADFYRVAMDKVLRVTVPVRLTGEAKGIKAQGGILDFVHRELVIECLPGNIPEHIAVDVTELMLHQGVRVRDLQTGGTWKAVSEPDLLIVHVVSPRAEAEAVPAEEAAAVVPGAPAEPEVIKKGKVEKAEEEEKE
jgi:large subunit ribosomal protein L25